MKESELRLHPDVKAAFRWGDTAEEDIFAGIVTPQQTHTANVGIVTDPAQSFPETDALITRLPGVTVGVRTADCVPILLYASDIKAVAAVHAGWKGSLHGIIDNTVDELVSMGADPTSIFAAFGPSICGDCYEVSPDLAEMFRNAGFGDCVSQRQRKDPLTGEDMAAERPHIDLQVVNVRRLLNAGVPQTHIVPSSVCTRHAASLNLPSYRRLPGTTNRLLTTISL